MKSLFLTAFILFVGVQSVSCWGQTDFSSPSGPLPPPRTSDVNVSSNVLATRNYYEGAETIGRVGHEAILKRDILHQIRKLAHIEYLNRKDEIPEEQQEKFKQAILEQYLNSSEVYSGILDAYIRKLLFYTDYVVSRPKDQVKEQTSQLEKEFDTKVVPEMMKMFHCETGRDLEEYFETEIQSTLAQEKRIFLQETLGELWLGYNLGEDTYEPTVVDLRRYYEGCRESLYREPARVRWQSMSVMFSRHTSREEAHEKIVQMGNRVLQGKNNTEQENLFADVARQESEDFFASKGGYRDWTEKGTLNSKVVEDAIFSEELPVGRMSRILEDSKGFVIVRIIERQQEHCRPFTEIQEDLRKQMLANRKKSLQLQYEEMLSKRYTIEIYDITSEEWRRQVKVDRHDEMSATGRGDEEKENILREQAGE